MEFALSVVSVARSRADWRVSCANGCLPVLQRRKQAAERGLWVHLPQRPCSPTRKGRCQLNEAHWYATCYFYPFDRTVFLASLGEDDALAREAADCANADDPGLFEHLIESFEIQRLPRKPSLVLHASNDLTFFRELEAVTYDELCKATGAPNAYQQVIDNEDDNELSALWSLVRAEAILVNWRDRLKRNYAPEALRAFHPDPLEEDASINENDNVSSGKREENAERAGLPAMTSLSSNADPRRKTSLWVRADDASRRSGLSADTIRKRANRDGWYIEKSGELNVYRIEDLESVWRDRNFRHDATGK